MAAAPPTPKPRPKAKRLSGAASYLVWGSLAVCAVVAASVLIALGIGASRGGFGVAQTTTVRPPPTVVQKPQAATEFEVARLNDALRALAAERERLAARVDQLERSVGDITASVNSVKERAAPIPANAQPEAKPATVSPATPIPAVTAEPTEQPSPPTPRGAIAQSAPPASIQATAPPPAVELEPAKPSPFFRPSGPGQLGARPPPAPKAVKVNPPPPPQISPPIVAATKGPPTQVAQIMPPANLPGADSGTNKTEFAIDLGGDMSIDGLRARWANIKGNHGAALAGMRPLVSVREGAKPGTVELRLIAGPVANAGDAAKVCANLQTKGVACRTTEFDGQKLSLR
jgi:hypothetical protein